MKWGYNRGYAEGLLQGLDRGRTEANADFERLLAVLREEMSDLRRDRDCQLSRADAAADLLLQHLGARAISLAGQQEEAAATERKIRGISTLAQLGDPTEDLPLGDPRGTFKTAKEASLFAGEDIATAEG